MELCECCKDHQTCDLDKRTKGLTDASCGAFEKVAGLSGEAYQTLKSWRTHPYQPEGTADHARFLSIPMALTEKALWPTNLSAAIFMKGT